jgi:hypothetical protein
MADIVDVVIIGAASSILATIVVNKFFTSSPQGGGQPKQQSQISYTARHGKVYPWVPSYSPSDAAPLAQNTPITEAAYNQQPTQYAPTLGPNENTSGQPIVLVA